MNYFSVFIFLLMTSFNVLACWSQNESYFYTHPKALQGAVAQCPGVAPKHVSCEELHEVALKINEYVYELRMSPQAFGKTILSLQEMIAKQAKEPDSKKQMEQNKAELHERLAIVKWLESPES